MRLVLLRIDPDVAGDLWLHPDGGVFTYHGVPVELEEGTEGGLTSTGSCRLVDGAWGWLDDQALFEAHNGLSTTAVV